MHHIRLLKGKQIDDDELPTSLRRIVDGVVFAADGQLQLSYGFCWRGRMVKRGAWAKNCICSVWREVVADGSADVECRQTTFVRAEQPSFPSPSRSAALPSSDKCIRAPGLIKTHHVHSTTERGREKKYLILSERLSNLVNAPPPLFFITSRSPHESRIEVRTSFLTRRRHAGLIAKQRS